MLRQRRCLFLATVLLVVAPGAHASVIFLFSFDNATGNTAGPISGAITLPDVCISCAALDITLTSIGGHEGTRHVAPVAVLPGWSTTVNSFTVTDGEISAWNAEFTHLEISPFSSHADTLSLGQSGVSAPFYRTGFEQITFGPPCGLFGCTIFRTPVIDITSAALNTISFTAMSNTPSVGPVLGVPAPSVISLLALGFAAMVLVEGSRHQKPAAEKAPPSGLRPA